MNNVEKRVLKNQLVLIVAVENIISTSKNPSISTIELLNEAYLNTIEIMDKEGE